MWEDSAITHFATVRFLPLFFSFHGRPYVCADHYILLLWFLLLLSLFSSPVLSGRRFDLPYFHTCCGCGLNVNLECRPEMCCTRFAENTGRKNSPSAHHRTTLSGYMFATKACVDNRKNLLNSNTSSTCPHNMVNFVPLTAEIGSTGFASWLSFAIWSTAFNRGRHLYSVGRPSRWAAAHIIVSFFFGLFVARTGRAGGPILTIRHRRLSAQGCVFWGFRWYASPFRGEIPQTQILGCE